MSIARPRSPDSTPSFDAETVREVALRPVEAAGFWAAVSLPLAYPALMVGGLGGNDLVLLLVAALLHVLALAIGRDYAR